MKKSTLITQIICLVTLIICFIIRYIRNPEITEPLAFGLILILIVILMIIITVWQYKKGM